MSFQKKLGLFIANDITKEGKKVTVWYFKESSRCSLDDKRHSKRDVCKSENSSEESDHSDTDENIEKSCALVITVMILISHLYLAVLHQGLGIH